MITWKNGSGADEKGRSERRSGGSERERQRGEEIGTMRIIDNALRNLFAQVDSFLIILSLS